MKRWNNRVMSNRIIIGIDPDVKDSGVARLDCSTRQVRIASLPFPDLLDYLRRAKLTATAANTPCVVVIEAGWMNRTHWHISPRDSRQAAAAKGNQVGRNHETGRKIAEMCRHWQIPFVLQRPLPLRAGGRPLWSGKDGKASQADIEAFMAFTPSRTPQEGRDAALLAWHHAGLPIVINRQSKQK